MADADQDEAIARFEDAMRRSPFHYLWEAKRALDGSVFSNLDQLIEHALSGDHEHLIQTVREFYIALADRPDSIEIWMYACLSDRRLRHYEPSVSLWRALVAEAQYDGITDPEAFLDWLEWNGFLGEPAYGIYTSKDELMNLRKLWTELVGTENDPSWDRFSPLSRHNEEVVDEDSEVMSHRSLWPVKHSEDPHAADLRQRLSPYEASRISRAVALLILARFVEKT